MQIQRKGHRSRTVTGMEPVKDIVNRRKTDRIPEENDETVNQGKLIPEKYNSYECES